MNILFLSLIKAEKIDKTNIYHSLLLEFQKDGHNVYMVSPRERNTRLTTELDIHNDINILKVRTGNMVKTNIFEKGLSTVLIERQYLNAIEKFYSDVKFDLILYATPPITFSKVVSNIKKRDNAKTYLLLKDIFPQNAVDLGMFSKNGPISAYFRRKEKELYEISDYIGCMSEANVKYVLENNPEVSKNKVEVAPNSITPIKNNIGYQQVKDIREKYDIPLDKSVFIYGGNLGKPQGIDFLIKCIKKNEANQNSYFLIVGSGTEFNKLKTFFDNEKPKNAKLLSELPKSDYEMLASTCDVGLIFLDKRFTIPNFPSRLLSYMQASMPILAATDPNTDVGDVIESDGFGYSCISDDADHFNDLVNKLTDKELQKSMGEKSRNYLENNYTSQHTYDIIMKHFE